MGTVLVTLSVNAQEPGHKERTPEQKQERKEMIGKYDTNRDGKLDKDERSKMSNEDKARMKAMRGNKGGKQLGQGAGRWRQVSSRPAHASSIHRTSSPATAGGGKAAS